MERNKKAAEQWIRDGKPCRYRCGFAWKGAWLRPLANEEALEILPKYRFTDDPTFYELMWGKDGETEVLIFNEYSESDLW